jgi:hypothetical protein
MQLGLKLIFLERFFPLSQGCDMMQGSITVPLTRDHSSSRCDQECGDRIRTGMKNALVIKFSQPEEEGREPGRQDHRVIVDPSDGQSFPAYNGIDPLFSGHSLCFLPHRFGLQQVFHIRDEPNASFERYPQSVDVAAGGGFEGLSGYRMACNKRKRAFYLENLITAFKGNELYYSIL